MPVGAVQRRPRLLTWSGRCARHADRTDREQLGGTVRGPGCSARWRPRTIPRRGPSGLRVRGRSRRASSGVGRPPIPPRTRTALPGTTAPSPPDPDRSSAGRCAPPPQPETSPPTREGASRPRTSFLITMAFYRPRTIFAQPSAPCSPSRRKGFTAETLRRAQHLRGDAPCRKAPHTARKQPPGIEADVPMSESRCLELPYSHHHSRLCPAAWRCARSGGTVPGDVPGPAHRRGACRPVSSAHGDAFAAGTAPAASWRCSPRAEQPGHGWSRSPPETRPAARPTAASSERPDQRPQLIRVAPWPEVPLPHERTDEHPRRQSQDHWLL